MADTYTIKRFFMNGPSEVLKTGVTLEEAQEHCQDENTSSKTATSRDAVQLTEKRGPWFDGYLIEGNWDY